VVKQKRRSPDQTIGSRIGYRIDRFLALHPAVQLLAVLGSALVLAFLFGCAVYLIDDSHGAAPDQQGKVGSVVDGLWWAITRMLDGGTVTYDSGPLRQIFGLGVTLIGMLAVAIITGSFASSFSERLRDLRRGALPVFEEGHVVFLGWNVHGAVIVRELAVSGIEATLVIVADHDREIIEDSVREQIERRAHRLSVIVRRGDPTTTASARRAAVHKARAVVILPEVHPSATFSSRQGEPWVLPPGACLDRIALRSLLAVKRVLGGRQRPVIVDVATSRGNQLMRLCESSEAVVVVDGHGVNARLLAQSVRQEGAFNVIQQILSLDARSVFIHQASSFAGKTFDEAHAAIEDGILIGLSHEDKARLSPAGDHRIDKDEHLLIFSDNSHPPRATGALPSVGDGALAGDAAAPLPPPSRPLSVLVIRYRPELDEILRFLDARGESKVTVMVRAADVARVREAIERVALSRTTALVVSGDPLEGQDIDRLLGAHHDVALLLAPEVSAADVADADADQLITLLHLRRAGDAAPRAVVEIRSQETKHLTRPIAHREDFLLKRETVGMLLAQELHAICLERAGAWVGPVYNSILDAIGPSIELLPMSAYASKSQRPSFGQIMAHARRRGQVAIGVAPEGGAPWLLPNREERFDVARARVVVIQPRACSAPR
jgi:precorrin-6B methylase 1